MEIHSGLFPISSRTLVARLRDMVKDQLLERTDFGGNPPHIEYALTERGRLLLPIVDDLRVLGQSLDCNECEDRKKHLGFYCEACPNNVAPSEPEPFARAPLPRRRQDDSIVLL
jgi:hypothetical protein